MRNASPVSKIFILVEAKTPEHFSAFSLLRISCGFRYRMVSFFLKTTTYGVLIFLLAQYVAMLFLWFYPVSKGKLIPAIPMLF